MSDYKVVSGKLSENRYDSIQIFRFIAALMVIILHATHYTNERLDPTMSIYHKGGNGVRLFFVISGFVMILSSQNLKEKVGGWKIFAIKRLIRIVPIYWIVTTYKLAVLLVAGSLIHAAKLDLGYIMKSYLFIPAKDINGDISPLLGVGWTLNLEMFFYLIFTIALFFRINAVLFLSLVFIPLAILSFYNTPNWPDIRFYAQALVLDFLYGIIAGQLIISGKRIPNALAILCIFLGMLYLFLPKIEFFPALYYQEYLVTGVVAFLVIYGCACVDKFWKTKPSWLVYLGGASYSLYLIHPLVAPIVPGLFKFAKIHWSYLSVIFSVLLAIAAGTAFYKYCETPLTKFLTKHAKKHKLI